MRCGGAAAGVLSSSLRPWRKLFTPLPKSPIISLMRPRPNSTRMTSAMIRIWNGPIDTRNLRRLFCLSLGAFLGVFQRGGFVWLVVRFARLVLGLHDEILVSLVDRVEQASGLQFLDSRQVAAVGEAEMAEELGRGRVDHRPPWHFAPPGDAHPACFH